MGSRYLFIVFYVWLEHHLSRGDYRRNDLASAAAKDDNAEYVVGHRS
jgi:dolichol-phosphate mannosyltransferase